MSFKTLVAITDDLVKYYPKNTAWQSSSFNWIRGLPPGSKGTVGRNIATGLFNHYGLTATTHKSQIRVNGNGISVKLALMWDSGVLKFQNIRDTDFDFALCLGLYPSHAFGWLVPKGEIWANHAVRNDRPGITRQHKGADAWIHIEPKSPHKWLEPFGGSIDDLVHVAKHSL